MVKHWSAFYIPVLVDKKLKTLQKGACVVFLINLQQKNKKNIMPSWCHDAAEQPCPRSVRFAEITIVHDIMALDEYTPNEIDATWFSGDEYDRMLKANREVICKMKTNETSEYCSRGLECMTGPRLDLLKQNRTKAYDAVLFQQLVQWKQGREDKEKIAELYRRISIECQMEAIRIGKQDANIADF
jgi:hypothetical protein